MSASQQSSGFLGLWVWVSLFSCFCWEGDGSKPSPGAKWFAQARKLLVLRQRELGTGGNWGATRAVEHIPVPLPTLPPSQRQGRTVSNAENAHFGCGRRRGGVDVTQRLAGLPRSAPCQGLWVPWPSQDTSPPAKPGGGPKGRGSAGSPPPLPLKAGVGRAAGVMLAGAKSKLNRLSLSHRKSGQESGTSKQHHPRGRTGAGRANQRPGSGRQQELRVWICTCDTCRGPAPGSQSLHRVPLGLWVRRNSGAAAAITPVLSVLGGGGGGGGGAVQQRVFSAGVTLSLLVRFASHTEQLRRRLGFFFVVGKAPTSILRPVQDRW